MQPETVLVSYPNGVISETSGSEINVTSETKQSPSGNLISV